MEFDAMTQKINNVNGPINVVRIEGDVMGIKKHAYLFMDYHMQVYDQTECHQIDSIDLNKYMINEFKKASTNPNTKDEIYDLFLEINCHWDGISLLENAK